MPASAAIAKPLRTIYAGWLPPSALMPDTETGPGVFETALAYTDSGRMADNAILFKFVAKSVGMKYGITPTFMAKPYSDVRLLLYLYHLFLLLLADIVLKEET